MFPVRFTTHLSASSFPFALCISCVLSSQHVGIQVGYLAARPRTLHPKHGRLSRQYKSLAALGAFALAPVSVQKLCSAGKHQVFTSVAPCVVPTQPGSVIKAAVETGACLHCNIGTCKTEWVQVMKLSCLHVTLSRLMKRAISLLKYDLPLQPLLFV